MSSHIQIGDIDPRIQHTATGSQTHFDFPFPIFNAEDLEVFQGDDLVPAGGYQVAGAGNSNGGTVTFPVASPPLAGTVVTLRRRLTIDRTYDLRDNRSVSGLEHNDEADRQTAMLQQVASAVTRSLRLRATDGNADLELPAKADRADKLLAFDADGNVTARAATERGGDTVSDHGALTGLDADDHPQYLNASRADGWLASKSLDAIAEGKTNRHFTEAEAARLAEAAAHAADTGNPHGVTKAQIGLGHVADLKGRLDATSDPTPTDDLDAGYAVGSRWINIATDQEFVCVDAARGAAAWKPTTMSGDDGISDHGALTGLDADDHAQYLNATRADGWLKAKSTDDVAEGAANKYMTLAGNGTAGTAARSDHHHDGTYAAANHGHPGLVPTGGNAGQVLAKASGASHDMAWRDQPAGGEVNTASNVNVAGTGVFKQKSGSNLEFRGIKAGSNRVSTGLDADGNEISIDVNEAGLNLANMGGSLGSNAAHGSRGGGTLHAAATTSTAGFMTAADKSKLNGIEAGAQANTVSTVFGRTGAVAAQAGDYVASQIRNDSAIAGSTVAGALETLEAEIQQIAPGTNRAIVAPATDDTSISLELPSAVDRRDFLLGFTATGAVTTTKTATAKDVDDLAMRGMRSVKNIAELRRSAQRSTGVPIYVEGYATPGDGGGGVFRWDAASTATPDGGTIFEADGGGTGRWLRQINGPGDVRWFGAQEGQPASTAIGAALQAMYDGAFGTLVIPPGTWPLDVNVSKTMRDRTGVVADGANFVPYQGNMGAIFLSGGGKYINTTLTSDILEDGMTTTLESMVGVDKDMLIQIYSDEAWIGGTITSTWSDRLAEVHLIRAVDADDSKIWLDAPAIQSITSAGSTEVGGTGVIHARTKPLSKDNFWRGGYFDCQNINQYGLSFSGMLRLRVDDVTVVNATFGNIYISGCAHDRIKNCCVMYTGTVEPDGTSWNSGYGYGIFHAETCYSVVIGCHGGRGWNSFEAAGARDVQYIGCSSFSDTRGFNSHPRVSRIIMDGCVAEGKRCVGLYASETIINGGSYIGTGLEGAVPHKRMKFTKVTGAVFNAYEGTTICAIGNNTSGILPEYEGLWPIRYWIEYNNCTFGGFVNGDGSVFTRTYAGHPVWVSTVRFNNCSFKDVLIEARAAKRIFVTSCTFENWHAQVLQTLGAGVGVTRAYISGCCLSGTNSANSPQPFRLVNISAYVDNFKDDAGNVFAWFGEPGVGGTSEIYVTNSVFSKPASFFNNALLVRLLKNCVFLTGTEVDLRSINGYAIEHEENNLFMESLS